MRYRKILAVFLATLLGVSVAAAREEGQPLDEESRLLRATEVLKDLSSSRDQGIPYRLLERAYGIAVIPGVTKIGFLLGGRHGNGVFVMRDKDGRFTNPFFISITGLSFGWQAGVQASDIVLVFTTRRGVEGVTGGKVTLGADADVAAGPVGREASAGTDAGFSAEIYSYSRSRGVFAGLALDGSAITIDSGADADFYGKRGVLASEIASGAVRTSDYAARLFLRAVTAAAEGRQVPTSLASSAAEPLAPSAPKTGATVFPLSDQHPGQEPDRQ